MSAPAHASPDAIDVVSLLAGLARRWRLLALISIGAAAVTFVGSLMIRPTYTSEAQVAIVARGEANPFADPKSGAPGESVAVRMDREAINTHAKALQAPDLAQRVAAELKLAERDEFKAAAGQQRAGGRPDDALLAQFARRLAVQPSKDSRTILIRFSAHDRELAADIADRLGEAYRESLAARSLSESDEVQKGLVPRIDRLKQEAAEADAAVERFRGSANLFRSPSQAGSLNDQQLGEMAAAESKARTEHAEADARARAARQLEAGGEVHPDAQKSPVLQKLLQDRARIEGEIAKATAMLKEGHPAMKQLRSELTATERQVKLEIARVVEGLDKEVAVAALRLASVRRSLAELKARVVDTGGDQARLAQLEANARAKRGELERLQAQYEANRARADARIVPVEVQIVSRARPAAEATFPRPLPYAGLAGLAALLLSASLLIARDLIAGARPALSQPIPTATSAQSPEQTVAPRPAPDARPALQVASGGDRPRPDKQMDTIADVANRLIARRTAQQGVRSLVAGASASFDPCTEAIELTRTLARAGGPVLLIDWSLDGIGAARLLGVPVSPGIAELIDGKASFADVIGRVPGSAAQMVASGAGLVSAAGRGDVDRLNLLLDTLDEIYEQVVVVARFHAARDLFETLEGRFDFGVLVGGMAEPSGEEATEATFLGFEVDDLEVIRLARHTASGQRRAARERAA